MDQHTGKAWSFVPFPLLASPGMRSFSVADCSLHWLCQSTTVSLLLQSECFRFLSLHSACLPTFNVMFGVRKLTDLFCLCLNSVTIWTESTPWRMWGFRNAHDLHGLIIQFVIWFQNSRRASKNVFLSLIEGRGNYLVSVGRKTNGTGILKKTLTRPRVICNIFTKISS